MLGFLPARSAARRTRLGAVKDVPATLVMFESPSRLGGSLADMAAVLGERDAVVARELTKLHEELRRGSLSELAAWAAAGEVQGEITVVIAPPAARETDDATIEARLAIALETMSVRDAARAVADALGASRSRVYDLAIALRKGEDG